MYNLIILTIHVSLIQHCLHLLFYRKFDILTQTTLKRKAARLVCQRKTLYLQINLSINYGDVTKTNIYK